MTHRDDIQPGDVIQHGHHNLAVTRVDGDTVVVNYRDGQRGLVVVPEELRVVGLAGEGIFAHFAYMRLNE